MSKFTLPVLPYAYDALEPFIDAKTMEIHHSKHHQAYIDKLNEAVDGVPSLEGLSVEELVQNLDKVPLGKKDIIKNHGGGHANHSLFWNIMIPGGKGVSANLEKQLTDQFGSFSKCKEDVAEASLTHFGSGWGWLVLNNKQRFEVVSTSNQDSPLMYGYKPLLGIDVWEHAYYLKYQNRRAEYLEAFWNVVNWEEVEINMSK